MDGVPVVVAPVRARARAPLRHIARPYMRGRWRRTGAYGRYQKFSREHKFHEARVSIPGDSISSSLSGASIELLTIPQGTLPTQRIGRKIFIQKMQLRYTITANAQADMLLTDNIVRIMLVVDKQTNGTAIITSDVNETVAELQSYSNLNNAGRFIILMDRFHMLNQQVSSAVTPFEAGQKAQFYHYFKKCNIPILYDSTTGVVSEICCNNVYLLAQARHATARLNFQWRIRFVD